MTPRALVSEAAQILAARGIEAPVREARLLLEAASGWSRTNLIAHAERPLKSAVEVSFRALLARRAKGEPVSRILGRREFWSLEFLIGPEVLDPRPDSETLVEAVLERIADRQANLRILDLGTGSGCLVLTLLSELPKACGIGVDISVQAVQLAATNARSLGLDNRASFVVADWAAGIGGPVDIVISNPPYIASAEIPTLDVGVRDYDPLAALDGGGDGLAAYRTLMPALAGLFAPDGFAVVEIGMGQGEAVTAIAESAGLTCLAIRPDLARIPRAFVCAPKAVTKITVGNSVNGG